MPFYICPAMILAARKENCKIHFYHIDKNFYPVCEFDKGSYVLYPDYFGICAENVLKLSGLYKNLIVDNAHNFYMPDCGLASFNSYRKFFNIKDGAELFISQKAEGNFPDDTYFYSKEDAQSDYEKLVQNEKRLDGEGIKFISKCTEEYFSKIDINAEKSRRLKNFKELHKKYGCTNELKINLTEYDVPFVYPYLIKDETTGLQLEKEGQLIFRYWKELPENFPEYDFYKYLIPIPL